MADATLLINLRDACVEEPRPCGVFRGLFTAAAVVEEVEEEEEEDVGLVVLVVLVGLTAEVVLADNLFLAVVGWGGGGWVVAFCWVAMPGGGAVAAFFGLAMPGGGRGALGMVGGRAGRAALGGPRGKLAVAAGETLTPSVLSVTTNSMPSVAGDAPSLVP